MSYHPRLTDARVRARIERAYGFARGVFSETEAHSWSTRYIDRYFGQQQNALSQWLRQQLLICVNDRYNKDRGETKQYQLNTAGVAYIRHCLQGGSGTITDYAAENHDTNLDCLTQADHHRFDEQCVAQWVFREFGRELDAGQFDYQDKSSRLWHPLQSVKRIYKKPLLAQHGLAYHYDIQCSAPTLIHQHAQQQQDPMDLYLFALRRYLDNRTSIRQELAQKADIDVRQAKILINALFCGARLGNNPDFALSQLLGNDSARIEYLKQDPYITELRDDIKICWTYIQPSMARRSIQDKNNRTRMLPISSREKWMRYFELERIVLNSVIDYMRDRSMKYFLEHDGWACNQLIDISELSEYVFDSTGYRVQFECEQVITANQRALSLRELVE